MLTTFVPALLIDIICKKKTVPALANTGSFLVSIVSQDLPGKAGAGIGSRSGESRLAPRAGHLPVICRSFVG